MTADALPPEPAGSSPRVVIREYREPDRAAVRGIAAATAFFERPDAVVAGREILADALTRPFLDPPAASCLVAEDRDGGGVVGYLIGTLDLKQTNRTLFLRVAPEIFAKACARGVFLRGRNLRFCGRVIGGWLRGEFRAPDFTAEYPASFHINLRTGYRGQGTGGRLVGRFLDELRSRSVRGVQVGTLSEPANAFFRKEGFRVLFQAKRSHLADAAGGPVTASILGRKL